MDLSNIAARMTRDAKRLEELLSAKQWIEAYGPKNATPKDDLAVAVIINRGSAFAASKFASDEYTRTIMSNWPEIHRWTLESVDAEIESIRQKYKAVLE